ncbi:hypothetical protein QBC38DRAFT_267627 [Podospora fimiseda]|uniref:Uncharacterized protein n=1 Tax=Podospora fimiseda TaxID=252190 RepID=A0AAN7BL93_9PEZI|nr:hypothetical protein QBC38DRAFT_267627 [Podospora fimiseda]
MTGTGIGWGGRQEMGYVWSIWSNGIIKRSLQVQRQEKKQKKKRYHKNKTSMSLHRAKHVSGFHDGGCHSHTTFPISSLLTFSLSFPFGYHIFLLYHLFSPHLLSVCCFRFLFCPKSFLVSYFPITPSRLQGNFMYYSFVSDFLPWCGLLVSSFLL